jgi:hypothetical protein
MGLTACKKCPIPKNPSINASTIPNNLASIPILSAIYFLE